MAESLGPNVIRLPEVVTEAAQFDVSPGEGVTFDLRGTTRLAKPAVLGLRNVARHTPVNLLLAPGSDVARLLTTLFHGCLRRSLCGDADEWELHV